MAAIPDHIAAMIQKLQASPEVVTALGGDATRIRDRRPQDAVPDGSYIAVVAAGKWGVERDLPRSNRQVDMFCYAADKEIAMVIYRTVHGALIPANRQGMSFTYAGCRVTQVFELSGPQDLDDEGWPCVWAAFVAQCWETVQA